MTRAWAVIAARGGDHAKSRLSPCLGAAHRAELVACMLQDMLRALSSCHNLDGVLITTPTPALASIALAFGVQLLWDSGIGLNEAFAGAGAALDGAYPRAGSVFLPGDLPFLDPREVDDLIASLDQWPSVVVATNDGGTGAWARRADTPAEPRFGPNSARRHLEQTAGGHAAPPDAFSSLQRDIDLPADLEGLASGQRASSLFIRAHSVNFARRF